MERQLRLAERRGLLMGKELSPIAEFGLELLYFMDAQNANTAEVEAVKVAMIANDPTRIKVFYPQWFLESPDDDVNTVLDGTPEAEAAMAEGSYEEDYSEVEWISPDDEEFAELMQLAQAVAQTSEITMQQDEGGEWL